VCKETVHRTRSFALLARAAGANLAPIRRVASLVAIVAVLVVLAAPSTTHHGGATAPPRIDSLFAALARDTTHDIKGVIVVRDDHVIAEKYFNGDDSTTLHDIRSATKSITGLLTGIAIDQGLIASVDVPVSAILPLPARQTDTLRLRDLLTMRSGLDSDDRDSLSAGNEVRLDQSDDWLTFAAHVPMVSRPGEHYIYSSLNAYLLGAAVEHAAHEPLAKYADRYLFTPLGIHRYAWRRGPRGEGVGQGNLSITLRDMANNGAMIMHDGVVDGHRVVSRQWLQQSLSAIVPIDSVDRYADAYGYLWYQKSYVVGADTVLVHFASGNGGNKIYIMPQERLIVAVTSSAYNTRYGQRRSESILLAVLQALRPRGRAG
jgi:CubicO group peptidase (beta-lactamase class C family)